MLTVRKLVNNRLLVSFVLNWLPCISDQVCKSFCEFQYKAEGLDAKSN